MSEAKQQLPGRPLTCWHSCSSGFFKQALSLAGVALLAMTISAQTLTVLKTFPLTVVNTNLAALTNDDGAGPDARLVLSGGTLYGTTGGGGHYGFGTLFRMDTNGSGFTVLHHFAANFVPPTEIVVSNGMIYGEVSQDGERPNYYGSIFSMDTNGKGFLTIHQFTNFDGALPSGRLLLSGGVLYGTTVGGGMLTPPFNAGNGTLFKLNTNGTGFVNLHKFTDALGANGTNSDGYAPDSGLTIVGSTLYGTAPFGGIYGYGTVFKIDTDGNNFTAIHQFDVPDGNSPHAELVLAGNTLYGVVYGGSGDGFLFTINTDNDGYSSLYSFPSGVFGVLPVDTGNHSGDAQTDSRDRIEQEWREPAAAAFGFERASAQIQELPARPQEAAALFAANLSPGGAGSAADRGNHLFCG